MTRSGKTYTVIGTADNALGVATELRLGGNRVILTDQAARQGTLDALKAAPGIDLDCAVESFVGGKQQVLVTGIEITGDLRMAVSAADVIIVMAPQTFYEELLSLCGDCLRDEQIVLLSPGGLGGSLLVSRIAAQAGAPRLLVGQTSAMPIGARLVGTHGLRVTSKKKSVTVGIFPASRTQEMLDRLASDFPQLVASANVIETGFAGAALGLHPIPMIMNAARIEADGPYVYDGYEITPTVARVIDAVDAERQQILKALGAPVTSFSDILRASYGVEGASFYEVVHKVAAYQQVKSPPDLLYRYLSEDVPTQLVPAVSLARSLGIEAPVLDATVTFANAMHGRDYRASGWNLEKLGLAGLSAPQILSYLKDGAAAR